MAGTSTAYNYTGAGGTASAATQWFLANQSAWVNAAAVNGTSDYFVQSGVTCVVGTANALYVNSPQLFVPLQVTKGVGP